MIHQLIFAHPKPGMSENKFQDYWVNIHAVQYACKIPQIRRYLINTRIAFGHEPDDPLYSGVAEIWLKNEKEQIDSLQSDEFIHGARADEPNWAAFWRTIALDTNAHVIMKGQPPSRDSSMVKLFILVKRKEGIPLNVFRKYSLDVHAPMAMKLPGLRQYYQCHVRDSAYAIGESILDCVYQLWFDNIGALQKMMDSAAYDDLKQNLLNFVEERYIHILATEEHWIIGP